MVARALASAPLLLLWSCSAPKETPSPKASVSYFKPDPATAGRISGKVRFPGQPPKRRPIRMDSEEACSKAHKTPPLNEDVLVAAGGALANAMVHIKTGLEGKNFEPAQAAVQIDQKGCMFAPRVVGLRVGQTLRITNSDPVTHNIHPLPRANREWNQGQPPGAAALERAFSTPEPMMPVKCNVHAWMRAYISVMPHPYFAVTGADGTFELKDVPPGGYTLEASHERFGSQEVNVTVAPSGAATADFVLKGE